MQEKKFEDKRFAPERKQILEVLSTIYDEEHKEFLSHLLNITSRTEMNGHGYDYKLLPCSHYGIKHNLITLLPLNYQSNTCLESMAKRFCPFYNDNKDDHCDYKGNKT